MVLHFKVVYGDVYRARDIFPYKTFSALLPYAEKHLECTTFLTII